MEQRARRVLGLIMSACCVVATFVVITGIVKMAL